MKQLNEQKGLTQQIIPTGEPVAAPIGSWCQR